MSTTQQGMRVYCHVHRRSFSADSMGQVTCDSGDHVLGYAPNDPAQADVWEYCCDCQNFWLVGPDGPGVAQCPVCHRAPVERYMCDICNTLTLEGVGPSSSRAFYLSLQGLPLPSCPGCSLSENKTLHEHMCKVYAATITTPQTRCRFCQEKLAGPHEFPMSVGEFLSVFEGERLEVVLSAEAGHLSQTTAGPLVVQQANGFQNHLLIPKVPQLESKSQFLQLYKDFYRCDAPAPGEIIIVYPATARREGNNWVLKDPGRLRIKTVEAEKESPSPEVAENHGAVPTQQPVQLDPEFTIAAPQSQERAAFVPGTSVKMATPSESLSQVFSTSWRLIILVCLSALVIGGILVVLIVNQLSDRILPRQPEQAGSERARDNHGPASWPGMVFVPGGQFTMGSDDGDEYEKPAHRVSVRPFFIDAHEVTCNEYAKFIKATGRQAPPGWTNGTYPSGHARLPVTGVDWFEAKAYAAWAGKRLPTEEEWELAARGFDQRKYPWGNDWRSQSANAGEFSAGELVNVGSYPEGKSPFGALDMVGNAWEWTTSDLKAYPGATLTRPHGERKIIRGGSWVRDYPPDWTTTFRGFAAPSGGKDYSKTGFRCAKDAVTRQEIDTAKSK